MNGELKTDIKDLRWKYVAQGKGNHRSHTAEEYAQINEIFDDVLKIVDKHDNEDDMK